MKKSSTMFLKMAVILIGLSILVLGIIGMPWLINNPVNSEYSPILYPIITGMYLTAIPFFIALYHAIQLLNYIDRTQAFSTLSVKSLKIIKNCAFTITGLYVLLMPFVFFLADKDDAPGIVIFGMAFVFATLVVAVFASVLQKLLEEINNRN